MSNNRTSIFTLLFTATLLVATSTAEAVPQRRANNAPKNQVRGQGAQRRARAAADRPAGVRARPAGGRQAELAAGKPSQQAHKTLKAALKSSNSKYYTKEVNGTKRIIANVNGQAALDKVSAAMGRNANVLQIIHIHDNNIMHTLAAFDGELIHTQFIGGTSNWRLRNWGNGFRASNSKMYSAYVSLTPEEGQTLRKYIVQARKDQGPEETAGPKWENGKLKNTSMGGNRTFNCTSVWSDMPLGKGGETLTNLVGLNGMASGSPRGFQRALETHGNERVIGIAVMGPKVENFAGDKAKVVTEL